MQIIKQSLITIIICVVLLTGVNLICVAWSGPPYGGVCSDPPCPPGGNVPAPINVGSLGQEKVGGLILNTGGAANGLIVSKGNVGIGTASPSEKLDIRNGSIQVMGGPDSGIKISPVDFGAEITGIGTAQALLIRGGSGGEPRVGIGPGLDSVSGNVDRPLKVVGSVLNRHTAAFCDTKDGQCVAIGGINGKASIQGAGPSGYQDLYLNYNGKSVAIGGQGMTNWNDKLQVFNGNIRVAREDGLSASLALFPNNAVEVSTQNWVIGARTDTNLVFYNYANGDMAKMDPNGNLWIKGGLTQSSDLNLKKDILSIENAVEKIKGINGVYFNWKDENISKEKQVGVIAQEVEKVFPEVVSGADGSKTVEYNKLIPLLIEAVKEQQKEIDSLKQEIEVLKK